MGKIVGADGKPTTTQEQDDLKEALKTSVNIRDLKAGDVVIVRVKPNMMSPQSVAAMMDYWKRYFISIGKKAPLLLVFTDEVSFEILSLEDACNMVEGFLDNPEKAPEDVLRTPRGKNPVAGFVLKGGSE